MKIEHRWEFGDLGAVTVDGYIVVGWQGDRVFVPQHCTGRDNPLLTREHINALVTAVRAWREAT